MRVKSYYASSIEEAMSQASAEMGSDAVLVHSRKSAAETRHLGPYEVVFALSRKNDVQPAEPAEAKIPSRPGAEPPSDSWHLSLEMLQLRRQMEEIRRTLSIRNHVSPAAVPQTFTDQLWRLLATTGMDPDLALEIAATVARVESDEVTMTEISALASAARPELVRRLQPDASGNEKPPALAVIGPPGAGKTALLVKIAVHLQESAGAPVQLVCADPFRIGGADQLRSYAGLLGSGFELAETPSAIRRIVETHREGRAVLIDTPGLSGTDFELILETGRTLAVDRKVRKVLVLPATMRATDLRRMLRQYDPFQPTSLAFTRLDETDAFGALYSAAAWSGLPVGYLSAGQQVPEDLEVPKVDRIVDLVLGSSANDAGAVN